MPTWVTLDATNGVFAFNPPSDVSGTFTITFSISDGINTLSASF